MVKKLFDFFVFTSLFIACCALLMVYQTTWLFGLPLPLPLAGFVFCGTVCSYNFHWFLTPPDPIGATKKIKWNITYKKIHLFLYIAGLAGSLFFCILLINHWFWLGVTAFITFLYSAPKITHPLAFLLRKVAIGKTIFLALAWAHITAFLPVALLSDKIQAQHIWFALNRFFYIYGICIVFDFRDVEEDRKAGIRSLITYLNEKGIDLLFWGTMLGFLITLAILFSYFSIPVLIALLIPGVILAFLYYPSKKSSSDYLYYFVLDGLMMLSAPLVLLTKFAA